MKRNVLIGIVVVVVLAVAGFFIVTGSKYNNTSTTPTTQAPSGQNAATPASNTVTIQNFAFNPASLTVKQGTKVTWGNKDSVDHTVVFAGFNSQNISTNGTFEHVFGAKGTFTYHCSIHPNMTGTITVE